MARRGRRGTWGRSAVGGYRPDAAALEAARILLAPWHWLTAPRFEGLSNIPSDRPFMLAGNHTIMGVLDVPLMLLEVYERTGIFPRRWGITSTSGCPCGGSWCGAWGRSRERARTAAR